MPGKTYPISETIHLAEKAALIQKKNRESKNASGENFNIFSVLRLERDETALHSRFLAELLNPKGRHGQKTLFLKKFLDRLLIPYESVPALEQATVCTEESIGLVSADGLYGERIDITIRIPDQVIVIENKIDASDQRHQLIRYKNAFPLVPSVYLLYLTKDGRCPSKQSTHICRNGIEEMLVEFSQDEKEKRSSCKKQIKVSYKEDILIWLEECYSEVTRVPLLRENVHQYITIVKHMTNQTLDNRTATELAEKLTDSKETLEGYFLLRKDNGVAKAVEHRLLLKFIEQVEEKIKAENLSLLWDGENNRNLFGHVGGDRRESELEFLVPDSDFGMSLGFDEWRMNFFVSIFPAFLKRKVESIAVAITKELSSLGNALSHPKYYYVLYFNEAQDRSDKKLSTWDEGDMEIWGKVYSGEAAARVIEYFKTFMQVLRKLNLLSRAQGLSSTNMGSHHS